MEAQKAKIFFNTATEKGKVLEVTSDYAASYDLSDDEVKARIATTDPSAEIIKFARIALASYPDARDIVVQKERNAAQLVLFLIFVIISLPLLVILGMHHKFLMKSFYSNREGEAYDKFAKTYMFIGIALYVAVIALIVVGAIVLSSLIGAGLGLLFGGGIVYAILSFVLTKKYIVAKNPAAEETDDNE